MNRLNGKTAVVTGGGSGIGFAMAERFVDEGAFVFLFGRRGDVLDAAAAKLGSHAAVQGSASDLADLDRLYAAVAARGQGLDILVANAGTGELLPLGEITPEHFDRTFDVNVKGTLFTVQKGLPLMRAGGSIILTGSTTGEMGTPSFSVYSASKAAVRNFARSWALDLKGTGIRVNVVSPGPTRTELALDVIGTETFEALGASTPIGRLGDPSEVAAAAAFLASADSSFMTGAEVFVDGGYAQV
jgi:NAD(P)-dependent dehydrogenase (short-subunit alcohol dehydrogenase family)